MSTDLSPENEQFIRVQLTTGVFASREEVLEAGIELLRKRDDLLQRVKESRRQLDSGEFTQYDDDGLAARFVDLKNNAQQPDDKRE